MSFYASNDRIYLTDTNGAIVFDTNTDIPHILGVYEVNLKKAFYENYYTEDYFTIATLPDDCDFIICRAYCVPYNLEGIPFDPANPGNSGLTGGARGHAAYDLLPAKRVATPLDWVVTARQGGSFFQGSLPLEMGQTMVMSGGQYVAAQYARRLMHVYVEKDWGNKLVCMFQQSVKSGFGAVPSTNMNDGSGVYKLSVPRYVGWGDTDKPLNQRTVVDYAYQTDGSETRWGNHYDWVYWRTGRIQTSDGEYYYKDDVDQYLTRTPVFGPAGVRWEINLKVWAGKFRA